MHLCLPFVALILVLLPVIFLTSIAAIFHKIAAIITYLQSHIINSGDATGSTTHHVSHIL
jgi:hypothetical protein